MLRRSCLLVLLAAAHANAQPATPPATISMTLAEAQTYARAHEPQLRSALAQFAARRAEARVPRAEWLPQLGATAQLYEGTANNSSASYLSTAETDIPRIGGTKSNGHNWRPSASSLLAVSLSQEVYDFGRISAQIAVADAVAAQARASAEATQLDIQLAVDESYAAVLAAKHVLTATEEALKRARAHRDYAAAGVRSGLQPPVSLTRAEAEVAQLDVRMIQATSGVAAAQAGLAAAIAFDGMMVDAVEVAADATPTPALDAMFAEAARQNPALASAAAKLQAANAEIHVTTRELLPNLSASAGLSGRAGGNAASSAATGQPTVPVGDGWLPDVPNWYVGLVLQWNIFDARVLARRDAAKARRDAARFDVDTTRRAVDLAVQRAWIDLDATLKIVPAVRITVDAARANVEQADARFRAGLGNILELVDAENVLTNAQLQLAVAQFNVDRARAELGRAIGRAAFPLTNALGRTTP